MRRGLWSLLCAVVSAVVISVVGAGAALASGTACPNEQFRTGPSAGLPDCRAYEQVSPEDKNGQPAVSGIFPAQTTPNGEGLAYLNFTGAFSGASSGSYPDAYLATRTEKVWNNVNVAPPTPDPTPPGGDPVSYNFSEDLTQLVLGVPAQQLAQGATPAIYNLFATPTTTQNYSWVDDLTPAHIPPEGCSSQNLSGCFQEHDLVAFAGASANYQHVLFESNASFPAALGASEPFANLYESTLESGQWFVKLAGVLPDGAIPAAGSTAGSGSSVVYNSHNYAIDLRVDNAMSYNGSQVVFQARADGGEPDSSQVNKTEVYDRLNGHETIELSAPASGATPALTTPEEAKFWAASANGARVFFTSKAELTTHSYTGATAPRGQDLYEYSFERAKEQKTPLKDLTEDTNLPADEASGADVEGVVGISQDGSYVYFVAKGQLVPGKGVDHEDNLYMVHNGGTPVYIATLSPKRSFKEPGDSGDWAAKAAELEAYVTPNGRHLAFTSRKSLPVANFPSGYNNVNIATGAAEPEVYEYAAPSETEERQGREGTTVCASCNPTGAPPVGPGLLAGVKEPGAKGSGASTPFHPVRAVNDSGTRVFFTSSDPLVAAADGNTQRKIYEYETQGAGSCNTVNGCSYLISGTDSSEAAIFLDADATGSNVFFATDSRLVTTDRDSLRDVYDARIEGGLASQAPNTACEAGCRITVNAAQNEAPLLSAFSGQSGNTLHNAETTKTRRGAHHARVTKHSLTPVCKRRVRHVVTMRARGRALQRCIARVRKKRRRRQPGRMGRAFAHGRRSTGKVRKSQ